VSQPSGNGSLLPPVLVLNDSIPGVTPFDWIITGEGYQQQYQAWFFHKYASAMYDLFRAQSPLKGRRISWRVFFLPSCSTDQGVSNDPAFPEWPTRRTMYGFDHADNSYDTALLSANLITAQTALGLSTSFGIMLINSRGKEGRAEVVAQKMVFAPVGDGYDGSERVFVHEYGHLHGLRDEYTHNQTGSLEPVYPNVTLNTDRASLKWLRLVNTPVSPWPTDMTLMPNTLLPGGTDWPESIALSDPFPPNGVGLYRGAYGWDNAYRPSHDCTMRKVEFPFCAVCQNHLEGEFAPYIAGDVAPYEYRAFGFNTLLGTGAKCWLMPNILESINYNPPAASSLLGSKTVQRAGTIDYLTITLEVPLTGTTFDCYIEINGNQQNTSQVHIGSGANFGIASGLGLGVSIDDKVSISCTPSTSSSASIRMRGHIGVH